MAHSSHSWVQAYQQAVEGTNLEKLHERVTAAELAIFNRWQELSDSPEGNTEAEVLERAWGQLLKIKAERLEWPGLDAVQKFHRSKE